MKGSPRGPVTSRVSIPARASIAALLDAAAACYAQGQFDEAARLYRRAETAAPTDIRPPYSLAVIDLRQGRAQAARRRLRAVLARDPDHYLAQRNLGAACQALGLWPEATDAFARALTLRPDIAEIRFDLARSLAILGRVAEAIGCYRTLSEDPAERRRALIRIAILDPTAIDENELADLRAAAADAGMEAETRAGLWFALGDVLDQRREDDEAFAAYAAGNRLKHQALSAAPAAQRPDAVAKAHAEAVRFIEGGFTAEVMARHPGAGAASVAPIFIVGMPRSGSSLIEQILGAHSRVQAMGESETLSRCFDPHIPDAAEPALGRAQRSRLAESYLAAMRQRGWKAAPRFVDKTLENHLRVGMIHLMFPRAVILHSVRDPVDTCLACYRQLFVSGNETLYDLRQIGQAYVLYRRVMRHWAKLLPGRVIEVDHEALVADPAARIRWLVSEACGLDWDPNCLRFHEARGAVRTASAAQVRRPIFQTSLQRWRRYEAHLGPLFEALGPYAPARTS